MSTIVSNGYLTDKNGQRMEIVDAEARAKLGAVYELIETITLDEAAAIDRTAEPDGTFYNLRAIAIKTTTTSESSGTCRMYYYCGDTYVASAYYDAISSAGTRYKIDIVEPVYGYWRMLTSTWRTNSSTYGALESGGATMMLMHSIKNYPAITRIKTNNSMPAGTTIEIWGVRADA